MKKVSIAEKMDVVAMVLLLGILVCMVSGCTTQKGMATGWNFQIGVVPVTAVDNTQTLGTVK